MDARVYLYRYTSSIIHCGIFVHSYTIQGIIYVCGVRVDAWSCGCVSACVGRCVCVGTCSCEHAYVCVCVCVCVCV